MHLETSEKSISKNRKEVFEFLSTLKNFEQLMPENIEKFEVLNENRFLFALKGMPEIVLERKSQTEFNELVLGAASDKIPFTLTANLEEVSQSETTVKLNFEGEFNAMMAMMIKAPITKFIDTLSDNLQKI